MSFLDKLTAKPWLAGQSAIDDLHGGYEFRQPTVKLGLVLFLVVVTVLFSLLVIVYSDRMTFPDWRHFHVPWLLWPNLALLILSSVTLERARIGARRGQMDAVRIGLLAAGVFAFAFLVGQLLAWQQLYVSGHYASTNPASAFFYLFTALHGLHLSGGLVALGRTTAKVLRGFEASRVRLSVDLCAIYWHFLLVVWLILFGLLLLT